MTPARMANDMCSPTCPAVDKAFSNLIEALDEMVPRSIRLDMISAVNDCCNEVKDVGTERLRSALEECCSELIEAQSNVADLEKQVADLQDEINHMETV
jgi:hypothetical protein